MRVTPMTFAFESLTDADRARLVDQDIKIHHHRPHASEWAIDRATGDFLIMIAPAPHPPHWIRFAFHCGGELYGAEFHLDATNASNGYRGAVMKVWKALGDWHFSGAEADALLDRLSAAYAAWCTAHAARLFESLAQTHGVAPPDRAPVVRTGVRGFQQLPVLILEADYPAATP
jgi:hypothetical protein